MIWAITKDLPLQEYTKEVYPPSIDRRNKMIFNYCDEFNHHDGTYPTCDTMPDKRYFDKYTGTLSEGQNGTSWTQHYLGLQ